ncbi:E3 ubiquitin-protein ligase PRT1 [Physcomitrium patens]|uniref:RING-type domain-containing protein n=1 Tax=Physcomitrium patens TaxID=3218 RepID=A0A7I4ETR5_PHYPA|nr:E3 ubiquitin-protein ligase PRT1-like [Physcomitrium patens]|eukprot:XP_024364426.1 E3 ubiquitin-protein ligase PRT1-like [Physcomitrella patens]
METYEELEQFQCIICMELVYKPIVHACGHYFCFWCVNKAMRGDFKSFCPLCRRPYMHFPRICEQLHFILLKSAHDKYLNRAREVQKEEDERGVFSPQLDDYGLRSRNTPFDINRLVTPSRKTSEVASSADAETVVSSNQSTELGSVCSPNSSSSNVTKLCITKQTDLVWPILISEPSSSSKGKAPVADEAEIDFEVQEMPTQDEDSNDSLSHLVITASDLTCSHCCNLLYRPVVLNCGHLFCEHCIVVGDDDSINCPSCKAEHPEMFPQVCLELQYYIDKIFPLEYARRSVQVTAERRERPKNISQLSMFADHEVSMKASTRKKLHGPIHTTVGCDGCGMRPIIGKRFKCEDCPDAVGFDFCGKCYESGCVVGRFNQRHTLEHRMKEVRLPSLGRPI